MSRLQRIKVPGHAAGYHVVTRANGREFRLNDGMKEYFIKLLQRLKTVFYLRVGAFTIMDNHYHLLLQFKDPEDIDPNDALERWNAYHAGTVFMRNASYSDQIVHELTDISSFMKRLNYHMTVRYNQENNTSGTLWERRFSSTVIERGWAFLTCAAYIELNSFRASLVRVPEDYKYSSINWLRNGNEDGLIDIDLLDQGLGVSEEFEGTGEGECSNELYRAYLAFIYESGSTAHRDETGMPKEGGIVITEEMKRMLLRYGIGAERGSLSQRISAYVSGKFAGGVEFILRNYESFINPGYSGKRRDRHRKSWVRCIGKKVFGLVYFEDDVLAVRSVVNENIEDIGFR